MPHTSSSPASSTATLLTTCAAEKTVLVPQGKDSVAALGSLQTQFGSCGSIPSPAPAPATTPRSLNGSKRAWWKRRREPSGHALQPERQASAPTSASAQPAGGRYSEAASGQLQSPSGPEGSVPARKDTLRPQYIQWNA